MKKTGSIWELDSTERENEISVVCKKLKDSYGSTRLGNPIDPVDDLVYIILSNKTSPSQARKVYEDIKSRYPSWQDLLNSTENDLYKLVEPAGLANKKTRYIKGSIKQIKQEYEDINLNELSNQPNEEIHDFLTSLPGVSDKVAKCILIFTMDKKVLPVDSHVHRIASRLGWTSRKRADQSHEELEALVPPDKRYNFHVNSILHGREICRPKMPKCDQCVINQYCKYYTE